MDAHPFSLSFPSDDTSAHGGVRSYNSADSTVVGKDELCHNPIYSRDHRETSVTSRTVSENLVNLIQYRTEINSTIALAPSPHSVTYRHHTSYRVEVYDRRKPGWELHRAGFSTRGGAEETANRLRDHRGNGNVRVVEEPSIVAVRRILERGRL